VCLTHVIINSTDRYVLMARGRYQKSDLSRERILESAIELFSARGYAAAGVDRVAERSGIAKTAIYYHFGNKEGLLVAVLERAATHWIDGIEQAARQGGEPLERLDRALAGMRAMLEERPWILKLFQLLALEVADHKPEVRATLQGIIGRARDAIVNGMREALGVAVPGAETVAGLLLALLDGVSLGAHITPTLLPYDDAFREIRRLVAFMIATRLNPELAALFDNPPDVLRLLPDGRRPTGDLDDDRSNQSDR